MKSSHLTTPRTLGECQFSPAMDPIEYYAGRPYSPAWCWAMALVAVAALVAIYLTR